MGCGASTPNPPAAASTDKPAASTPAAKVDLAVTFALFDTSGDGFLQLDELKRAFRAIGLQKRKGEDYELDQKTFASFDTNGDGKVSLKEFDAGLHEKTRKKLEEKLAAGWTFDAAKWAESKERHGKWNMEKVFKQFDTDADGGLSMEEFQRAFRAIGLKKRSGDKVEVDEAMFKSFDTNGDGKVSLQGAPAGRVPSCLRLRLPVSLIARVGGSYPHLGRVRG